MTMQYHKPIRSVVGVDEKHSCRRCRRILPFDQFAPLFDRPVRRRHKGETVNLLHPYCNKCRQQLSGEWVNHPKYTPAADRFFDVMRRASRAGAEKRGILFALRKDDLIGMWIHQGGLCALSGMEMMLEVGSGSRNDIRCSIDRINSSDPYIIGNVHLVCTIVNIMKNDLLHGRFVNLCEKIVRHQANKLDELEQALTL